MKATKAKLESYKPPRQGKSHGGKVNVPTFAPPKQGKGNLNLSMLRMAMSANRRGEAAHSSETMADAMATRRQGTIDRDSEMLELIDHHMQGIDELLNALSQ